MINIILPALCDKLSIFILSPVIPCFQLPLLSPQLHSLDYAILDTKSDLPQLVNPCLSRHILCLTEIYLQNTHIPPTFKSLGTLPLIVDRIPLALYHSPSHHFLSPSLFLFVPYKSIEVLSIRETQLSHFLRFREETKPRNGISTQQKQDKTSTFRITSIILTPGGWTPAQKHKY